MKKTFFTAFLSLFCATFAHAQYEPKAGDFSTEISFNPFSDNFHTFDLQGAKLKGVLFLSDANALRFSIGVGVNMKTNRNDIVIPQRDDYQNVSDYNFAYDVYNINKDDFTRTTSNAFALGLGFEHHFESINRLDLYVGVEAGFDYCYNKVYEEDNKYSSEYNSNNRYVKNTWLNTKTDTSSSYGVSLNLFTGANFYVYKSLYVGAEFGLGTSYVFAGNRTSEWTTTDKEATVKSGSTEVDVKDNNLSLKLYCEPSLHIGWTF